MVTISGQESFSQAERDGEMRESSDRDETPERTTILAIAGEPGELASWVDLLEQHNFQAIAAETGQVGLRVAREELPDLILCDTNLPDADGGDLLRALKQQVDTAAIPCILLSADPAIADFRMAMDLGADDYLNKPVNSEKLLKAIAVCLEKQNLVRQYYEQLFDRLLDYDRLTKLPNRLALRDRFAQFLEKHGLAGKKIGSAIVPVLCLSLDRFHRIHDHLGYAWGDRLLRLVAQRLEKTVGDRGIVACLNANEFAIVLDPATHKREVLSAVQLLRESFAQSFHLKKQEVFLTSSIGISLYPRDGSTIEKLLRRATRAMNDIRQQGGNSQGFYTAILNIGKANVLTLETEFRRAWERQELEVYYQPKVDLKTGKIVSCEALLRWQHPERGRMTPDKFLPIAEETGAIDEIGEWVLRTAGKQLRTWHQDGWKNLRIAVNISGRQFNQIDLRQRIAKVLAEIPLTYQYLELEFLESSLIQNPAIATQRLNAFKALGMQLAIDDFGTGYSSLNYLRQFPFDVVKIDPCFIHNLVDNPANQAITSAIVQMAHALNLKVVAEGVETEAELALLRQYRCDEIQGYLFSPPLSTAEFSQLLQSDKQLECGGG
jgi:diguanylate cyclase